MVLKKGLRASSENIIDRHQLYSIVLYCTVGGRSNWRFGDSRDSVLYCWQLWHPLERWKIVIFLRMFGNNIIIMVKTCVLNFKSRRYIQKKLCKIYQHGVAVRKVSQLPTLTSSQELRNFFFPMKILEWKHLYVVYMYGKFQVLKIHTKNNIPNLPPCVVLRNKEENHFITSNFGTLPRAENLLFQHEIFVTWSPLC